jgi:hypothetical protein
MLHCFPTTDVHLLMAAGRNQAIDLFLFAEWPAGTVGAPWTDLSTVPTLSATLVIVPPGATLITVTAHNTGGPTPVVGPAYTIAPAAVGVAMAQTSVSHPTVAIDPPDRFRLLRVSVHDDIDRFWIPIHAITMFEGESNRVVPITAIFDDTTQGDVTGHPYWTYASSDPTVARVDPDGRVRTFKNGGVDITVTLAGTALTQTVKLHVFPSLAGGRTADVVTWGSVSGDRRRIYVIAEGYNDAMRFEAHFRQLAMRWFGAPTNQPFGMLRDRFALFGIVDLVPTPGVTIGPTLAANGALFEARGGQTGLPIVPADLLLPMTVVDERDTTFGVIYGARIGDPQMRPFPATAANWLVPAREPRSIGIDWRRVPDVHTDPTLTFMDFLRRYLAAVAMNASGMPDGFGDVGPDDLVVLLCDDQRRGGELLSIAGRAQPERRVVTAAVGSDAGYANVVATATEPRRFDRTPNFSVLRSALASTVVHEIGHTFRLGDEYEFQRGRAAPGAATIAVLERFENLQTLDEMTDPAGGITSRPIKWYLPRVVEAARVTTAVVTSGSLRVGLAIDGADKLAWITPGAKLMLRGTLRTPRPGPGQPRLFLYEVTVDSISPSTVIATSVVPVPQAEIDIGAVLYQPLLDANGPVRLIAPAVAADLGTNGVFPKPAVRVAHPTNVGPCFDQDPAAPNETVNPRAIAGGPTTPDRFRIIGVYEGGNDVSCGIARPTGRCKLRLAFNFPTGPVVPFCHVCQYVIVDLVDPGQHARLDRDYPP